jgi:hypothetical protein
VRSANGLKSWRLQLPARDERYETIEVYWINENCQPGDEAR